ncbi:hypothetical protein [Rhodopila sp.]|uniref:hypothetical protein n=1 Tax=Rhodopila sp. TaxID=2480087 RepID=UPI003D103990
MATDRTALWAVPAAAALLLWPALWNGYPIVFADSGTYLSQAIEHYAGWDRPVFYSLFMLPLHATISVWPVIVAQALLAAWVLWLVAEALGLFAGAPGRVWGIAFVAGVGLLSACTWLPWLVCQLMPDLFTPLLVLAIWLLAWVPERLSPRQRVAMAALAGCMIATQMSSLPLACVLLALGAITSGARSGRLRPASVTIATGSAPPRLSAGRSWLLIVLPPALAVLGLCGVNLAAHKRFAISPFGNVFLLARVIYDGPGMAALRQDCPARQWCLCRFLDRFPANSDDFLWTEDSPLRRAGGPKVVSREAGAIITAALLADPLGEARAALGNGLEQLTRFASGDGLNAWPIQVSPVIERHFPPREQAEYAAARQQTGSLAMPPVLAFLHRIFGLTGILCCALLLPVAIRRRAACTGLLLTVLVALPLSAMITGSLSAPHDRYQARIMWLPPFVAALSTLCLRPQVSLRPRIPTRRPA